MTTLLLLALLHVFTYRSPVQAEFDADSLVRAVYAAGGLDAVAVVSMESDFRADAERREPRGTSWGLFQLYDRYHDQHRDNISAHIAAGARFLEECKYEAAVDSMGVPGANPTGNRADGRRESPIQSISPAASFSSAVARFNGGTKPGRYSIEWGMKVERRRDSLVHYLWLRLR